MRRLLHSSSRILSPRVRPQSRLIRNVQENRPASLTGIINHNNEKNADVTATMSSHSSIAREDPNASWFMDSKFPTDIANDPSTTVQRIAAVDESTHRTELDELVKHLVRDFKARNVAVIDMRDKCQWTDWMVVSEGVSEAHVKRMTRQFYQLIKKRKSSNKSNNAMIELSDGSQRPLNIEGRDTPDWQLIDLGRFVFHFFTPEARRLYNLEDLWSGVSAPSDNNIE